MVDKRTAQQLLGLMQDPRWSAMEEFLRDFKEINFGSPSAKRDTEFDTMWYLAEAEGGKRYLEQFFSDLEELAKNL